MKKIIIALLTLLLVLPLTLSNKVKAEGDAPSTSDWMPHRYILSGYDIPTVMSYDENSVSFSGSLNAGIATTGFNYVKPIDINNFSIEMDLDIPDIDLLSWICFTFLDTNLMRDLENTVAPVAQPFNAMSGRGGYENKEQTGLVLQLWTNALLTDNVLKLDYVSKNLDFETGEKTTSGWRPYTSNSIVNQVKLNETFDGKFKLAVNSVEGGLNFDIQDGAWKYQDDEGEYTQERSGLVYANSNGLAEYFKDKECYFACVLMYGDEIHRPVTLTVNKINGLNPSDNKEPSYLAPKTVEKDGLKVTVPASAIGQFGVYPSAVDDVKIVKYDEEDGDYETVQKRAKNLNGELIDYFRIVPQIGGKNLLLCDTIQVEYTLPSGFDDYKAYYINDDEETQALPKSYVQVADGKMTLKIDNEIITKVAIYGVMNEEEPNTPVNPTTATPSNTTGGNKDAKNGCKSMLSLTIAPFVIAGMGALVILKKKRDE